MRLLVTASWRPLGRIVTATTRLLYPIVATLAWAGATALLLRDSVNDVRARSLIQPLLFLAGIVALLSGSLRRTGGMQVGPRAWFIARAILAGTIVAIYLAFTSPHPASTLRVAAMLAPGAAAEEAVFRRVLPLALMHYLNPSAQWWRGRLAVFFTAQVCFALSHAAMGFGSLPAKAFSVAELVRLAAGGVVLQCIQIVYGLSAAIAAHTVFNVRLIMQPVPTWSAPGLLATIPVLVFGLVLLGLLSGSTQARDWYFNPFPRRS